MKDIHLLLWIGSDPKLDLSGRVPFKMQLQVTRKSFRHDHQDITLLKKDTIFDLPNALLQGRLKLTNTQTRHILDAKELFEIVQISSQGDSVDPDNPHLILKGCRPTFDYTVRAKRSTGDQRPSKNISWDADCQYELEVPEGDLGISSWRYGHTIGPTLGLPESDSESGGFVSRRTFRTRFVTASSLPEPPSLDISISLGAPTVSLSAEFATYLLVSVRLLGERAITFQKTLRGSPRSTLLHPGFGLDSFSRTDVATGEKIKVPECCVLTTGNPGLPRSAFITLDPQTPLTYKYKIRTPPNSEFGADIKSSMQGKEFIWRVEPTQVWWTEQSIDELFGEEKMIRQLGWKPPATLRSEDEVRFKVEE